MDLRAYIGLLFCSYEVNNIDNLISEAAKLTTYYLPWLNEYKDAQKFLSDYDKEILNKIANKVEVEHLYNEFINKVEYEDLKRAQELLNELKQHDNDYNINDLEMFLKCEPIYKRALHLSYEKKYDEAILKMNKISDYKDSSELINKWINKKEEIEQERIEAEKRKIEEENRKIEAKRQENISYANYRFENCDFKTAKYYYDKVNIVESSILCDMGINLCESLKNYENSILSENELKNIYNNCPEAIKKIFDFERKFKESDYKRKIISLLHSNNSDNLLLAYELFINRYVHSPRRGNCSNIEKLYDVFDLNESKIYKGLGFKEELEQLNENNVSINFLKKISDDTYWLNRDKVVNYRGQNFVFWKDVVELIIDKEIIENFNLEKLEMLIKTLDPKTAFYEIAERLYIKKKIEIFDFLFNEGKYDELITSYNSEEETIKTNENLYVSYIKSILITRNKKLVKTISFDNNSFIFAVSDYLKTNSNQKDFLIFLIDCYRNTKFEKDIINIIKFVYFNYGKKLDFMLVLDNIRVDAKYNIICDSINEIDESVFDYETLDITKINVCDFSKNSKILTNALENLKFLKEYIKRLKKKSIFIAFLRGFGSLMLPLSVLFFVLSYNTNEPSFVAALLCVIGFVFMVPGFPLLLIHIGFDRKKVRTDDAYRELKKYYPEMLIMTKLSLLYGFDYLSQIKK